KDWRWQSWTAPARGARSVGSDRLRSKRSWPKHNEAAQRRPRERIRSDLLTERSDLPSHREDPRLHLRRAHPQQLALERVSRERRALLPGHRVPSRVFHAGVRQHRRPGAARQGGRAPPGSVPARRRGAAPRGGPFRRDLHLQEQHEPHADAEKYRRLHIIVGDSNMSEIATYLKVGTAALVLSMIEDGYTVSHMELDDPVKAIREVARDTTLKKKIKLEDGRELTAIEIQRVYMERAKEYLGSLDD